MYRRKVGMQGGVGGRSALCSDPNSSFVFRLVGCISGTCRIGNGEESRES